MPEDKLRVLYDAVSQDYDVGTAEEFTAKLNDPVKRKAFYDGVGAEYDLGDYETFESKIAPEKKNSTPKPSFGSETVLPYVEGGSKTATSKSTSLSRSATPAKADEHIVTLSGDAPIAPTYPGLDTLPKQSRATRYQKAFDNQVSKIEAMRPEVEAITNKLSQMRPDENFDPSKAHAIANPQETINKFNNEVTKAQYFEKALQGQHKLEVMNNEDRNRFVDVGLNELGAMLNNSAAGMARMYGKLNKKVDTEAFQKWNERQADKQKDKAGYYREMLDESQGYTGKDISKIYDEKGLIGAIEYGAKKFTESAPITAYISGMSLLGLAPIANTQLFTGTAYDRYRELEGRTDMSEEAKLTNAALYGGAELLFEGVLTTGVTSLAKNYVKQFGKAQAKDELKKTILGTMRQGLKKVTPLTETLLEGMGEGATQLSQNLIDKYTDPTKSDIDPMNGVVDAAAIGAIGGSGFAAGTVGGALVNKYSNRTKLEKLQEEKDAIEKTIQQVSPQTAEILQDDAVKIQTEQNEIIANDRETLSDKMSEESREEVKNLSNQIDDLKVEMGNVDEAGKEILQTKIDEYQNEIDNTYKEAQRNNKADKPPPKADNASKTVNDEPSTDNEPATVGQVDNGTDRLEGEGFGDTKGTAPLADKNDTGSSDEPSAGGNTGTGPAPESNDKSPVKDASDIFNEDKTINLPKLSSYAEAIERGQARIERLSQSEEQGRTAGGRRNVEAAVIARASKGAGSPATSKERQVEALTEYAKQSGSWVEDAAAKFGEETERGSEASVHDNKDGTVTKVIAPYYSEDASDFLDRISLHNHLFPETKYTLEGFGKNDKGEFSFIVKQPFIKADDHASREEIESDLKERGFEKIGKDKYSNSHYILEDITPDNVLKTGDGNFQYIDTRISLNTPEFGGGTRVRSNGDIIQEPVNSQEKGASKNEEAKNEGQQTEEAGLLNESAGEKNSPGGTLEETPPADFTAEELEVENQKAKDEGFTSLKHKISAINKAAGTEFTRIQDIPAEVVAEVVEDRANETGVKHAETAKLRKEFGIPEYEKSAKSQEKLEAQADEKMKGGYDIDGLIKRLEDGELPTDVEQVIMRNYLAGFADKIAKNPTNELISQARRAIEASDRMGGSEVARSLAARRSLVPKDETLLDYFMQEMDANEGAPLTEAQKSRTQKEFEEINEVKKALEEKIAQLEDENNKLRAQKRVSGEKKSTAKRSHEDYAKERKQIAEDIRKKLKTIRKETHAAIIPYARELVAISPDVAKMVRSYVSEGVTKLEDIVSGIHADLVEDIPEITPADVRAVIAGNYNEKKLTRNEVARKVFELKQEAKLIEKLERLQNGVEPTIERKKIERNQELERLRKQIKESDLTKISSYKSRVQKNIQQLEDDLAAGNIKEAEPRPVLKLDAEAIKLKDQLIKLKQERELRIIKQQYANRSKYQKARDAIVEVLNVPRTIMSSMDFSAPLRQAVVATTSHPVVAAGAFVEMFKQAVSQKRFDRWFSDVREDYRFQVAHEAGLYIADPHDVRLSAKEEAFMNNLAEKIPVIGKMIKGSERAYVSYLNKMRWDLFNQFAEQYERDGKTMYNSPDLYKGLASFINNATGRGKFSGAAEGLESAAPILNTLLFSPRLVASRLNFLNPMYYAKLPKEVRVSALKDVAKFIATGSTVLFLMGLMGADVEDDPRSTDFGKIKFGNTRWDIWGGYQQYIRVLAQMLSGQTKSAMTGELSDLTGQGKFGRTRGDVALAFVRGKLAPVPSIAADILAGRTVTGEPVTIMNEAQSHLFPLITSDVGEAMKDKGIQALFTAGIPATFGVGVSTYENRHDKYMVADEESKMSANARYIMDKLSAENKVESEEKKAEKKAEMEELDKEFSVTEEEKKLREAVGKSKSAVGIIISELEKIEPGKREETLDRWLSIELAPNNIYDKITIDDSGEIKPAN